MSAILRASTIVVVLLCACSPLPRIGSRPPSAPPTASDVPAPTSPSPAPFHATSRHSFSDVAHWQSVFDDPARDEWQRPGVVVEALGIRPGMRVADLGAGTGYFSRYLANAVGENGTVFAVETEPNLVAHLRDRAEREHTPNVVPVLASDVNPRLPYHGLDLVLIVDTFHHIDQRLDYLRRLADVLGPDGRVAIVDFRAGDLPVGPPPDHKIPRDQVVYELEAAGFALIAEPDLLPFQYFLVFRSR